MGQRRQQKRLMAERKAAAQQAWIEKQKLIHEHYQQQCDPMKTAILDRCQEQEAFKAARPSQPQREQGSDQLRQHEHKQQQRSHLEPEQLERAEAYATTVAAASGFRGCGYAATSE